MSKVRDTSGLHLHISGNIKNTMKRPPGPEYIHGVLKAAEEDCAVVSNR